MYTFLHSAVCSHWNCSRRFSFQTCSFQRHHDFYWKHPATYDITRKLFVDGCVVTGCIVFCLFSGSKKHHQFCVFLLVITDKTPPYKNMLCHSEPLRLHIATDQLRHRRSRRVVVRPILMTLCRVFSWNDAEPRPRSDASYQYLV